MSQNFKIKLILIATIAIIFIGCTEKTTAPIQQINAKPIIESIMPDSSGIMYVPLGTTEPLQLRFTDYVDVLNWTMIDLDDTIIVSDIVTMPCLGYELYPPISSEGYMRIEIEAKNYLYDNNEDEFTESVFIVLAFLPEE